MSNLKYAKAPYLLDEAELINKPISDITELVSHIKEVTKEIVGDLAIHSNNLKLIHKLLSNKQNIVK